MSQLSAPPERDEPRVPSRVADAYQALKDAIRDNMFTPGHQGSEQEIALRLGMSRTPVHEALIRLQEEGLVRVLPKRGVIVCPLTPEDMREVYEVIISLEGTAAELLAGQDKPARLPAAAVLDEINAEMRSALARDDLDSWAKADDRFHRALIDHCGNRRLARLANTIMDQSHRARVMTLRLRAKPDRSFKEHQAIVERDQDRRCHEGICSCATTPAACARRVGALADAARAEEHVRAADRSPADDCRSAPPLHNACHAVDG